MHGKAKTQEYGSYFKVFSSCASAQLQKPGIKEIPHNAYCAVAPPIFRQTIPIEEARVTTSLPTKFVKYDGIEASICAIKALAVYP